MLKMLEWLDRVYRVTSRALTFNMEDIMPQKMQERLYPAALAVTFLSVYSVWYGPWGAVTLVSLCGISISGARLLQSEGLQRWRRYRGQPVTMQVGAARKHALYVTMALLVLLVVQVLVSPDTPWLLVSRWFLIPVVPLLAAAFEFIKTPKAELSEALADSQINYAQGAAWGFFLGYLMIRFGYGHGTHGEDNVATFTQRMADYLTSQDVQEDKRTCICKERMIILVPMKHEALLSDNNFSDNDSSVKKENVSHRKRSLRIIQSKNHLYRYIYGGLLLDIALLIATL